MDTEPPKPMHSPGDNRKPSKRRRPLVRSFLLRLGAIFLGIIPFLIVELLLRLFGIGHDLALIISVPDSPGWYQFNPLFDEAYFGQMDLSGPENRPFQLPKPRDLRRILVVGGSTVAGFPYPSELAFARHLQAELIEQSDGHETIEVLNAGITAISSSTEVAIIEEGLKANPDLIVVYTGHNEFYGTGGVALSTGALSPTWYRFAGIWRRLRLVQTLRNLTYLTKSRKPTPDLIEWLPGDHHIHLDSETFQKGLRAFQENLNGMAKLAGQAGIPIVFVSPVANEHDQPPIENLKADSNAGGESWRSKLRDGERELLWGDLSKAQEQLESARKEQESDPQIHFRLAQAYEKTGKIQDSIKQFATALDLDGCRFRAPSTFRTAMENIARQHQSMGAVFVDLHSAVCNDSAIAVPGRKHFLEHVHFTWEGNRLVGREIAKSIWRDVWLHEWRPDREMDDQTARQRLGVVNEDQVAAVARTIGFYQKLPFRDGLDAASLAKELVRESVTLFQRLPAEQQKRFMEEAKQESNKDMFAQLIRARLSAGSEELAESWLKARIVRQPWRCEWIRELTTWLRERGNSDQADQIQNNATKWPCRL